MKRTIRIVYVDTWNRQHEHTFTGTAEEIAAEVDRMVSLPDVKNCWVG